VAAGATLQVIQRAFELAGVELISDSDGQPARQPDHVWREGQKICEIKNL
jgi:hypothetical protein